MDKSTAISIFEKMDERQIIEADKAVKQAMVYTAKVNGEQTQEITFVGIKHLILQLAVKDNPLEILESVCELQKDDTEDKSTWHWRAYKKFRNINTRLESDGRSECPFLDKDGKYDPFAQRKADSKAERNAQRKQIPELVIKEFLKSVNSDQIQNIPDDGSTDDKPTASQINYYKNLGGQEPMPKTKEAMSIAIDKLKNNK